MVDFKDLRPYRIDEICVCLCIWGMVDDGWEYDMDRRMGWIDTYYVDS